MQKRVGTSEEVRNRAQLHTGSWVVKRQGDTAHRQVSQYPPDSDTVAQCAWRITRIAALSTGLGVSYTEMGISPSQVAHPRPSEEA